MCAGAHSWLLHPISYSNFTPSSSMGTLSNTASNASETTKNLKITPTSLLPDDLVTFMGPFSAIRDWFKFAAIGGVLETFRRLASYLYEKLQNSFFITATFEEDDDCFDWMMHWLSKHPSWSELRNLRISTRCFSLNGLGIMVPGEENDGQSLVSNKRPLAYLPDISFSTVVWYKRHWMRVTRLEQENGANRRREELLEIKIFARNHKILNQLLLEAKKSYVAAQEETIGIYVSDSSNSWRHLANRPKRPLNSIILDPGVKDALIADANDFLASKTWYATRGIPFRRGYLLYGAPGSGKTSMIHSLAGALGLDIYVITLSRAGMDDTVLTELTTDLPERCIALMEDIDAALTQNITRELNGDTDETLVQGKARNQRSSNAMSRVSLSGLLNALDGVGAQEGRILFATTNKYSSLDPALCRPGRMDVHIEFKLASKYQARELFKAFYLPNPKADKGEDDCGYSSNVEEFYEKDGNDLDLVDFSEPSNYEDEALSGVLVAGALHQHDTPRLPRQAIITLADAFADAVPERKVSMAALQGYLMMHKTYPLQAVKDAKSWIEKEIDRHECVTKGPAEVERSATN